MAKVNCEEAREVCDAQHVDGYPSVFLFEDGRRIEEYSGEQSATGIWKYILDHVGSFDPKAKKNDL